MASDQIYFDTSNNNFWAGDTQYFGESATYSVISGGQGNNVTGSHASVGGGQNNQALSNYSTIAGGLRNVAKARHAAILGGSKNEVSGRYAAVLGGQHNAAQGTTSLAAGNYANAGNNNSAVFGFSDALDASNMCQSTEDNQILFCANSLDLTQVSRVDWGDHLSTAIKSALDSVDVDTSNLEVASSTVIVPQETTVTETTAPEWYKSPLFYILIGSFVLSLGLIVTLFIQVRHLSRR